MQYIDGIQKMNETTHLMTKLSIFHIENCAINVVWGFGYFNDHLVDDENVRVDSKCIMKFDFHLARMLLSFCQMNLEWIIDDGG